MPSTLRLVALLGAVLLLVGGSTAVWSVAGQPNCESGYALAVDRVGADETPDARYDRVAFENLSADGQALVREAVESDDGLSALYPSSSALADARGRVVAYRGEQYVTTVVVSDCAASPAPLTLLGAAAGLVGSGTLVGTGAWWLVGR